MKKIIRIEPLSSFQYFSNFKTRLEIEYYSDGTNAIADAVYTYKIFNVVYFSNKYFLQNLQYSHMYLLCH